MVNNDSLAVYAMKKSKSLFWGILIGLSFLVVMPSWANEGRYFALEPDFVVNYGNGQDAQIRFMKVNVVLRVRNAADTVELTVHSDYIRHVIATTLSRQPLAVIHSADAQQALRDEILMQLQRVLEKETGDSLVDQVLFTNYIIQS